MSYIPDVGSPTIEVGTPTIKLAAGMAELADAQDSGSCPGNWVEVQVLSRAFPGFSFPGNDSLAGRSGWWVFLMLNR